MAEAGYGGSTSLSSALDGLPPPPAAPTDDASKPVVQDAYRTAASDFRSREDAADRELATATQRLKGIKLPPLQQIPAEPHMERTDPMSVWGSLAMMFAVFGSMAVKAPFTTALNAAAGVMNAYNNGDHVRYNEELKKWQIASQNAARMAQWEHEQYRDQLEGIRTSIDAAKAARPTIAMLNDQVARTLIDAGYPDEAVRVWNRRGSAARDLGDATDKAFKTMLARQSLMEIVKEHKELLDPKNRPELNRVWHALEQGKDPYAEKAEPEGAQKAKRAQEVLTALKNGHSVDIGGQHITPQDLKDYQSKNVDQANQTPKQRAIMKLMDEATTAARADISEDVEKEPAESAGGPGIVTRTLGAIGGIFRTEELPKDKKDLKVGTAYKMPPGSKHAGQTLVWNGETFEPPSGGDTEGIAPGL